MRAVQSAHLCVMDVLAYSSPFPKGNRASLGEAAGGLVGAASAVGFVLLGGAEGTRTDRIRLIESTRR